MMSAIVYTSNTGYTAEHARLLGESTGLAVCSLDEAETKLQKGCEIIYLGWLMAGKVQGYKKARERYRVRAVCGVGMGAAGEQLDDVRKANGLADSLPLFTLQGGFDMNKLHGVYKFMMQVMKLALRGKLAKKDNRTPEEDAVLEMLDHGASRVSKEQLSPVLAWYGQA